MLTISRKALHAKYGGRCAYCGKILHLRHGWERDHVKPLLRFKGRRYTFSGRNGCVHPEHHCESNLVAACIPCNQDKGSCDLETWRASLKWVGWQRGIKFYFERYEEGQR